MLSQGRAFVAVISVGILLSGVASQAATDTWSGSVSGVWNTSALNWNGGASAFTSSNDALFTGTPTNNVTTATGLTVGAITLDSTFTGTVTLTGSNTVTGPTTIQGGVLGISATNQLGASAISLNGGTLRVNTNSATITNTHVITVGASGGTINLEKTSGTTFTFIMGNAGNLTGSGTLTLTANGSLVHGGTGATDLVLGNANAGYTGNMVLQDGGILEYANAGGVGTGATFTVGNNGELSTFVTLSNAVALNSGSTLAFQNNNSGLFSGAITLNGDASVRLRDWYGTTNRNGTISSTITGAHTINVNSGGDLGTGSTLTLGGFDAKASSADIVMDSASLAINSSSGTAAASVTRANSLTIKTGNLTVTGVASQATNDVFGTLNLANGSSGNQQGYSTWTLSPNAATNTALTFTNLGTRTAGSWVAINSSTLGGTPGANVSNIFFSNAPSGSNLIGSGGSLASGTASVIPWMHDTSGGNIYGYDATVGVAPITTVNVNPDLATAGQNINWNTSSTLTADRNINSLQMAFSGINLGGHTLTVASGVITGDNGTLSNGTLDFGTAEGQILVHQVRTLNINSAITGSGGLTFVGYSVGSNKGNLVLGGANTFTGVTNFYGYGGGTNANLSLTNSLALQNSTLNNVSGRANQLNFGNGGTSGQTAYTFGGLSGNAGITLANNNTTVQAVALTVGGNGDSTTYSGNLTDGSAAGGSLIKTGSGTLTLSGTNTYTGGTTLNGGKLALGSSGAIGTTGTISFGGGALQHGASNTTDYSGRFSTAASQAYSVDTNGQNVTWATALTSIGGSLTKSGAGKLTLSGANTYDSGTIVNAGTLAFGNSFTMSGANKMSITGTGTAGTNYATVTSTSGTLTFGGTLQIDISTALSGGESFNLFQAGGGALAGDFGTTAGNVSITGSYLASLTDNSGIWTGTASGLNFTFTNSTGLLEVSVAAIPEPSTFSTLFGMVALLGAGLYRRRKS